MLKKISSYIIVLVIGAALGTYFDAKHTIETKIVTKDRIKTVVKEVVTKRPDGTTVTERHTTKDEKRKQVAKQKESIPVKKNWGVGVKYDIFRPESVYTIEAHRRVFGDLYISAYGRTDSTFGVGVTVFF